MYRIIIGFWLALLLSQTALTDGKPQVIMETSHGDLELVLKPELAPVTVKNFLSYVNSGFYDGSIFHRVIKDFMIQGGGFNANMQRLPTGDSIESEANNGLSNVRGTIAMARTQDINSATAQFFINHADNIFLDHTQSQSGYAVFGKVVKGMAVLDHIAVVENRQVGMFQNVPVIPVIIHRVRQKNP